MSQNFAPPPQLSPQFVAVIHSDSDLQVLFRWPDMPLGGQECDKVPNSVVEPMPGLLHLSGMCQKWQEPVESLQQDTTRARVNNRPGRTWKLLLEHFCNRL